MPKTHTERSTALLTNGRVLMTGGLGADIEFLGSYEAYDSGKHSWPPDTNLFDQRNGHCMIRFKDENVLVASGTDHGGTLASAEIFNSLADSATFAERISFHRLGNLPCYWMRVVGRYTSSEL